MNKNFQIVHCLARFCSILFHPIAMLFYGLILLLLVKPFWFGVLNSKDAVMYLLLVFMYSVFIPVIGIALLKLVGLLKSFQMEEKTDRIIPMLITMIFYFWMFINLKNHAQIPKVYIAFILGSLIALSLSFVLNLWIKISLHMIGISALGTLIFILRFQYCDDGHCPLKWFDGSLSTLSLNSLIILSFLLWGIVGSSRLILEAHQTEEIVLGSFIGIFSIGLGFSYIF
ncbi:MAG TPA: hypothetical protein PK006_06835 [Saprospiraceae bacterium]|nr:hypothetical protein [Saprospiraceae bacterium]